MQTRLWRGTRPDLYSFQLGAIDPSARRWHLVTAPSQEAARKSLAAKFPGERIDIHPFETFAS